MVAVKITAKEFLDICKREIPDGFVVAALSDQYIVSKWPMNKPLSKKDPFENESKIREIRIFNARQENKLVRRGVSNPAEAEDMASKAFLFRRIVDDDNLTEDAYYDEWQYLDIDVPKGFDGDGKVTTTGGGKFYYPLDPEVDAEGARPSENAKVGIRYYLGQYPETGQARVEDWRILGFER